MMRNTTDPQPPTFPLSTRLTRNALAEWYTCEEGSWEDHDRPDAGHVVPVIDRFKSKLEIRDAAELRLVWESLRLGTFGDANTFYGARYSRTRDRLVSWLRPYSLHLGLAQTWS